MRSEGVSFCINITNIKFIILLVDIFWYFYILNIFSLFPKCCWTAVIICEQFIIRIASHIISLTFNYAETDKSKEQNCYSDKLNNTLSEEYLSAGVAYILPNNVVWKMSYSYLRPLLENVFLLEVWNFIFLTAINTASLALVRFICFSNKINIIHRSKGDVSKFDTFFIF